MKYTNLQETNNPYSWIWLNYFLFYIILYGTWLFTD